MIAKDGKVLRILIVDDEVEFAQTLGMRLELRKFQIGIAHSGRAALDIMAQESYDLMLLDLKIPDIGGLEVAGILRDRGTSARIIVVSGDGPAGEEQVKLEAPVASYMAKPVELNALLKNISLLFPDDV